MPLFILALNVLAFMPFSLSKTPLYTVWYNMLNRCYSIKHESFKDYGERGIALCDEWRYDVTAFADWAMTNGWKRG